MTCPTEPFILKQPFDTYLDYAASFKRINEVFAHFLHIAFISEFDGAGRTLQIPFLQSLNTVLIMHCLHKHLQWSWGDQNNEPHTVAYLQEWRRKTMHILLTSKTPSRQLNGLHNLGPSSIRALWMTYCELQKRIKAGHIWALSIGRKGGMFPFKRNIFK